MTAPRIHPLGDTALFCELPAPATDAAQARIWAVAEQARQWPHVVEVVPGMNNLCIVFDPRATSAAELEPQVHALWRQAGQLTIASRDIEIPVRYGAEHGPDLEALATFAGLTPAEVIVRHAAARYLVYFVGFQPGFAYLGGLDPALHMPRRAEPRLTVPAGSVGIGGAQTGIYPAASPGGWQLIGRTELMLFDPAQTPPTLLQPGDRVRFTAVETK